MKLTVSCQICGRVIQEIDNGLGDEFPFSAEDVTMYSQSAICEVDGVQNIVTIFTRQLAADALQIKLGQAIVALADEEAYAGTLEASVSQLQYEISQLADAASLYDQVQQDQVTIDALQQESQQQTSLAQTYASALTQQRSLAQRAAELLDNIEYQVSGPIPNNGIVKPMTDEVQQLFTQVNAVSCDALGNPAPTPIGYWVYMPTQFDDFQDYLASQDPVIDPIPALDGQNMVEMTSAQHDAWTEFLNN